MKANQEMFMVYCPAGPRQSQATDSLKNQEVLFGLLTSHSNQAAMLSPKTQTACAAPVVGISPEVFQPASPLKREGLLTLSGQIINKLVKLLR